MEQIKNPNVVSVGPGGAIGHLIRMLACTCTGGFAYPNTFIEGMDCTTLDARWAEKKDKK